MTGIQRFWQRVTDGMEIHQLWDQFQTDARSSYRLYARDVDLTRAPETRRYKHYLNLGTRLFWAIVENLTPARRVLLLLGLFFLIADVVSSSRTGLRPLWFGQAFWGALMLLLLLLLEVGDRVVMKRDLQIAKEIQAWLLPPAPPPAPGLEIAFATRPANTVAGDYYDVFSRPRPDGQGETFLIAVADVAGKSIPAAMLMATFQASLKTLASTPSSLTELVTRMNGYACSNSQNGRRFTTAFIAEYDPASRSLTCVNAGHNPPLLRRYTGNIECLQSGGLPLGILAHAPYESEAVTLQCGDWLVIFTDGVTEAENYQGEAYGEARLWAVLRANVSATPSELLAAILLDLDRHVGNAPPHDDVTLLLLKAC